MSKKLILFVLPIGLWCGVISPVIRTNWYYVTGTIAVTSFIFLYNFPYFTKWMHTAPTYYDHLHDSTGKTKREQETYQRLFMHIMNLFLTIILCVLFNYAVYQTKDVDLSALHILSIIGSICGLHTKVQSNVGSVLVFVLHYSKERKRSRSLSMDNINIELGMVSSRELGMVSSRELGASEPRISPRNGNQILQIDVVQS